MICFVLDKFTVSSGDITGITFAGDQVSATTPDEPARTLVSMKYVHDQVTYRWSTSDSALAQDFVSAADSAGADVDVFVIGLRS